jgi:hypothetical protein
VKTTPAAARRLLREGNPVPEDAFPDAARDADGQAVLAAILASPALAASDTPRPGRRAASPGRSLIRTWKVTVPAVALTAALAGLLAVMLTATSAPRPGVAAPPGAAQPADSGIATLIADLTVHPPARPDSAAAELRALADAAAAQPAPALGPVVYTKTENWGLDLGTIHYGLGYHSHETSTEETWSGSDGAYLRVATYPGGKIPPGIIPVNTSAPSADGMKRYARYGPASLPATEPLMRQRLLQECQAGGLLCPSPDEAYNLVLNSIDVMGAEPMPPAARAALLRVLADAAATHGPNPAFYNLGSVTDRAGHQAVAIAVEYQRTATPGSSCAGSAMVSGSSSGKASVTCSGPGTASDSASSTASDSASGTASDSASGAGVSVTTSGSSGQGALPPEQPELWVLVFDPGTGAFLGEEFAYCAGPVGSQLATAKCTAESYAQVLAIKAVASVPPAPPGSTPNTPPVTYTPPPDTATP